MYSITNIYQYICILGKLSGLNALNSVDSHFELV